MRKNKIIISMFLKKFWNKIVNDRKYKELKYEEEKEKSILLFRKKFEPNINFIHDRIKTKNVLNFLHSGHAADIINVLPTIKKLSETHKCNLYINLNKPIKFYYKHPAGKFYLNKKIYLMLEPLLKRQEYLNEIAIYNNQNIDINFDLLRELPLNLLFDNVTYASVITGVQLDLTTPFISADNYNEHKDKIVIQRTFRYRNQFISYKFLNDFNNLLFVGTIEEFNDLKREIKNLIFYDCKNFLDMANIVNSSKFVLANSSITFPIAEGLQVPRLLESSPDFPAAQPHGKNAYNFYFQSHFEEKFNILNELNLK